MECPRCGYNEAVELMKSIPEIHNQCLSCKWWICAGAVGSYCSEESVPLKNTEGDCDYYAKPI